MGFGMKISHLKIGFILMLQVLLCYKVVGQQPTRRDTLKVGVYFTSLYDLDLANKSFNADFWIWFNYRNDSINPLESVEIANAKEYSFSNADVEEVNGIQWAEHKCRAVLKKEWDLRHFPFDKQRLDVRIEDAIEDTSVLWYVADTTDSKYDTGIELDEWTISNFYVKTQSKTYETTFGNPELKGGSTYPAVVASFELRRKGLGLFFKLFVGIYVAYVISLMVFFMGPENQERFGLIVGALFAGVANKYIVDSIMPRTIMLTLPDKIHNLTFAYIILHLAITVVAYRLAVKENFKKGWLVDRISFLVSIISYFLINWFLVKGALEYI
jgi:hypothetical protein